MCFVSSPKEGFIYNVFSKTEFLSHCTYTCDTKSVVIGENLLHAVTSQAVETYTIPLYAGVAKHARLNKPPDFNDKLEIVVPADTDETAVGSENNCDGTSQLSTGVGNSGSEFPDSGAKSQEVMTEEGIDIADFEFPVYDINILQKVFNSF